MARHAQEHPALDELGQNMLEVSLSPVLVSPLDEFLDEWEAKFKELQANGGDR